MNLYFDTEFTGLQKDTSLISLGIVDENGKKFYAEFNDYNKEQCNPWIVENVLSHLDLGATDPNAEKVAREVGDTTEVMGDKSWVRNELEKWLKQYDEAQFVADVGHYDFVLLTDVFGGAFDLPGNVSPTCHDINQDIADFYGISEKAAFDVTREKMAQELSPQDLEGNKHNALYDAMTCRAIYEGTHEPVKDIEIAEETQQTSIDDAIAKASEKAAEDSSKNSRKYNDFER